MKHPDTLSRLQLCPNGVGCGSWALQHARQALRELPLPEKHQRALPRRLARACEMADALEKDSLERLKIHLALPETP